MEKIYLIISGEYSDWNILYATTDGAAARLFMEKYNERVSSYEQVYIIEKPNYLPDVAIDNNFKTILELQFDKEGSYTKPYVYTFSEVAANPEPFEFQDSLQPQEVKDMLLTNGFYIEENHRGYNYYMLYDKTDGDIDWDESEKLYKIAKDNLMKYLAEKEGL